MNLQDLKGKKVALIGLGVNHKKLAEYLKAQNVGFEVVDNWKSTDDLIGKLDGFDIIFRTPGVPYQSKAIQQAKSHSVEIYSQTKLFLDLCPAKIIGVTGTKGKGTTASLIYEILKAAGKKTWLAGNIGQDPFEFIDKLKPDDLVVLELSSFQLEDLHKSPAIAVVLRLYPEHLDYHKSPEKYFEAKKPILKYQTRTDAAVINYDSEISRSFSKNTKAKIIWTSIGQKVNGCYVAGEKIFLSSPLRGEDNGGGEIMNVSDVKLLGRFNLENVTAAIAAAVAAGVNDFGAIKTAVANFTGLPHRLEFVRAVRGVKYYDDSFSTTPETAIAALSAFAEPIILIVGGSDKHADYGGLAQTIADKKIKVLISIGVTGPKIAELARNTGFKGKIIEEKLENMENLVAAASKAAEAGDIVLLSPASASFDMFRDYKDRGEQFQAAVNKL